MRDFNTTGISVSKQAPGILSLMFLWGGEAPQLKVSERRLTIVAIVFAAKTPI